MIGFLIISICWVISMMVLFDVNLNDQRKKLVSKVRPKQIQLESVDPTKNLSKPAKHVYAAYMKLPADMRPFPDIVSMLEGLDKATSYDQPKRISHYDENAYMVRFQVNKCGSTLAYARKLFPYQFAWKPSRGRDCELCDRVRYSKNRGEECEFISYYMLYQQITVILDELEERETKQLKRDNEHHLDMVRELTERLRSEAEIARQVTKELT